MAETSKKITMNNNGDAIAVFGAEDRNLRFIEDHSDIRILARGNEITISGQPQEVAVISKLFEKLLDLVHKGDAVNVQTIGFLLEDLKQEKEMNELSSKVPQLIYVNSRGVNIRAKNLAQMRYVRAISEKDLVFGIGPAGTGKTYLAVAMAVAALKKKEVERIILARPAVEAGEKLGFLPGDLQQKVDPYLRPLYDALFELLGMETAERYLERSIIEIAPLAYMRGRTLNDAFIILDEAQNTTPEQMKMFLTRIGFGSKAVVNGDITQIDLPTAQTSGLVEVQYILKNIEEIAFIYFSEADVIRHPLIQKIVHAYSEYKPV